MNDLVKGNMDIQISERKKNVSDTTMLKVLQIRIDESEKNEKSPFDDFDDLEMVQWFLYQPKHLKKEHDKSSRTIKEYEKELTQFIEYIIQYGREIDIDINEIKEGSLFKSLAPRHIRRYQEWLATESPFVKKKGSYSDATLSRKTTIIRNFLEFLYDTSYISDPIHKGLKTAAVKKDERPNRDLGPVEVMKLLDHFRAINHPIAFSIIHLLTTTGIRNEEFCKLQVKDICYDSISGNYYIDVQGKGNKRRHVPLKEKNYNSIRMFRYARGLEDLMEAEPTSPLFTTNTGKSYTPSYLSQYLTKIIKDTKLPFLEQRTSNIGPHTFRHAFAIISQKSGVDIYKIMRSLGHEKIETTMIYLQKIFEMEQHAVHSWNSDIFGEYI